MALNEKIDDVLCSYQLACVNNYVYKLVIVYLILYHTCYKIQRPILCKLIQ
jgi:hypothetical protein